MNLRYRVELSQAERDELKALLSGGRHVVRKVKRAQILLAADAGASDEEIATRLGVPARWERRALNRELKIKSFQGIGRALFVTCNKPMNAKQNFFGGGGRTRTYEAMRRLIYSQLPLPLGTLPREPRS
jgi:hypothetical protein